METVELIGHVDEQNRLWVDLPPGVVPGPVKVVLHLVPMGDVEASRAWSVAVATAWAEEWNDPREDIYTLEEGKPADEPRS